MAEPSLAQTRYARAADGTHVAYQVTGSGPVDIVFLRGWLTNVEHEWADPVLARVIRRLGSIGRVIRFDRRGGGLSDRVRSTEPPTLEARLDDFRAVLDAAESRRAFVIGLGNASSLCAVFAASHPDRTSGLVMYAPQRPGSSQTEAQRAAFEERVRTGWGSPATAELWVRANAPSRVGDRGLAAWLAEEQRLSGSAADAIVTFHIAEDTDIGDVLGSIHVPTLVLARSASGPDVAAEIAGQIAGARLALFPGDDYFLIAGDTDALIDEIERFIDAVRGAEPELDRILATLLFTDIVDSSGHLAAIGDRAWAEVLDVHHERIAAVVARFRGRVVDTAGDGVFAAFDGPGRAIRCALAAVGSVRDLGIEIRAGLHTGEVEAADGRLRGIAVHIAARVAALAGPSEVLASRTVRDLVAGSGFDFADRGTRDLKGIPGEWSIYAVLDPASDAPS